MTESGPVRLGFGYNNARAMVEYDTKAWYAIVFRLNGSVLPRLVPRVLLVTAVGALAAWVYATTKFYVSPLAHSLIGAALGLLLVFRTNASYDRFWEGRKALGMITNRSRDLARQIASWVPDPELRTLLRRQLVAMVGLINQGLRGERELAALGDLLTERERELLEPVAARHSAVAQWMTARLTELADTGQLSEQRLQQLDGNFTQLIDSLGAAERIMKTPVPFAYAQHIKTFVVVFCFTVPFAMTDALRWYTPIAAALLAFALFGIDEIGVEIEEPFGRDANDLPLDAILSTIERDTKQILQASMLAEPKPTSKVA